MIEFSRKEYWSGLPFSSPGDLPNPGTEPGPPALLADSLPSEPPGKPHEGRCMWYYLPQIAHYLTLAWALIKLLDSCGYHNLNLPGNGRGAFLEVQRLLLSWKMRLRGKEHCHIGTIFSSQLLVWGDQVSLWEMLPVSCISLSLKEEPEVEKWPPPSEESSPKDSLFIEVPVNFDFFSYSSVKKK